MKPIVALVAAIIVATNAGADQFGWTTAKPPGAVDPHLYQINLSTGIATDYGWINPHGIVGLSFGADGTTVYGLQMTTIYRPFPTFDLWNLTNPPGTHIGSVGSGLSGSRGGLDFHEPTGKLRAIYFVETGDVIMELDTLTGKPTLVWFYAHLPLDNLAYDPNGVGYSVDGTISPWAGLYRLDPNFWPTFIGPTGLPENSRFGTDFDAYGTLYAISNSDLYTVSLETGQATWTATIKLPNGTPLTDMECLAIPEVSSGWLLILGCLVYLRRVVHHDGVMREEHTRARRR